MSRFLHVVRVLVYGLVDGGLVVGNYPGPALSVKHDNFYELIKVLESADLLPLAAWELIAGVEHLLDPPFCDAWQARVTGSPDPSRRPLWSDASTP